MSQRTDDRFNVGDGALRIAAGIGGRINLGEVNFGVAGNVGLLRGAEVDPSRFHRSFGSSVVFGVGRANLLFQYSQFRMPYEVRIYAPGTTGFEQPPQAPLEVQERSKWQGFRWFGIGFRF